MTTQTVESLILVIYEANQGQYQVNNPEWWTNTMEQVQEEKSLNGQWPDLLEGIQKLLMKWKKFSKSWAVNSSSTLLAKMKEVPGDILAMSFNLEMMSNFLDLWNSYGPMVNQELMECLASASNTTTSILSTTAPIQTAPADVPSASTSNLSDLFVPQENITDLFGSLHQPTGMMSSFISSVVNKEHVKYGLEEQVGEYRLAVSTTLSFILFN